MKQEENPDKYEIYPAGIGVLGGWFCIDEAMTEDEALNWLWDKIKEGKTILEIPTDDKELFRDRLFGGFKCGTKDGKNRRHVYYALACYTFLNEPQTPMEDHRRKEQFVELMQKNDHFIGSNKFMKCCPTKGEINEIYKGRKNQTDKGPTKQSP